MTHSIDPFLRERVGTGHKTTATHSQSIIMTCATHLYDNVILSMCCSHVQKRVSTHVSDVGSGPSHEKHLHNVPVTVHASIVERGKAMLITVCVCL